MEHAVKTFDLYGKPIYEKSFKTAAEAYNEYLDIIDNMERELPTGHGIVVARYYKGFVMCMKTIDKSKEGKAQ